MAAVADDKAAAVAPSERKNSGSAGGKIQSETEPETKKSSVGQGKNNSVGKIKKVQSPTSGKRLKNSSGDNDDWRFEIKRKKRTAGRKNSGSTAKQEWYYWTVRVNKETGATVYYGTLDILDAANPDRLKKYWRRSK